jgi:hypothetical protein
LIEGREKKTAAGAEQLIRARLDIILTPHIACINKYAPPFCENIRIDRRGGPLRDLADPLRGS